MQIVLSLQTAVTHTSYDCNSSLTFWMISENFGRWSLSSFQHNSISEYLHVKWEENIVNTDKSV